MIICIYLTQYLACHGCLKVDSEKNTCTNLKYQMFIKKVIKQSTHICAEVF